MTKHSAERHGHRHMSGQDDDGDFPAIAHLDHDQLGLEGSLTGFIHHVDAILARPSSDHVAAGRNGATDAASQVFWTYSRDGEFHLRAVPGMLTTAAGNGGFSLEVEKDGSWHLKFDGSDKVIGHQAGEAQAPPPPPTSGMAIKTFPGAGATVFNSNTAVQPHVPVVLDGGLGIDTFQGGVGDYMIGGAAGLAPDRIPGTGNCALYGNSAGSVLVDMQNGFGYGGSAEGNVYVNINQAKGATNHPNILIGNTEGTDLKSGGDNSILISTGGDGFELRPDGRGNVLISTVGNDRVVFDPTHGWTLGDDNIMLGFHAGNVLDLQVLTAFEHLNVTAIGDYVQFQDIAGDGTHVMFDPAGQGGASSATVDLLDIRFTHGLDVGTMYANNLLRV